MATPNPGQPPQAKSVQDWMICVRAPTLPEQPSTAQSRSGRFRIVCSTSRRHGL